MSERVIGVRFPLGRRNVASGCDLHLLRIEGRQERLDLVVAERPEEFRRHHDGGRGRLGVVRRVELEEPGLTVGVPGRDAGVAARGLLPDDDPARRIRRGPDVGTTDNLVDRERSRPDAVGEPARVRELVDGVDVLRAPARGLASGQREEVVGQLVHQVDLRQCRAPGILRLGLAKDGIVAIKTRARGGHRAQPGDRRHRHDG